MTEKIFVTGATGHIGSHLVRRLVEAKVHTTVFARDEEKTKKLFEKEFSTGLVTFVKGDYDNKEAFTAGIAGHTRLLLLVASLDKMPAIKEQFATIAVNAGVKQIVDISSFTVKQMNKSGFISYAHAVGEEVIVKAAGHKCSVVHLRGGYFMTNHLHGEAHTIKTIGKLVSPGSPHNRVTLIDPRDIADVTATIFTDPIEKHGNVAYDVQTEALTNQQRADMFSKVLGKKIEFMQDDIQTFYDRYTKFGMPHSLAYDLISLSLFDFNDPQPQLCILTKKPLRTFEDWLKEHKSHFE
eukprot:TRINITY_DN10088_c0_g1_i1.p1 TRINITY_DN10088_c0_g1~~TRINITY_DN10088_c0_g1_i1.p1  ORF type:complete len:296 (+),score=38.93 TRINITY_DN10088_c0_g1_i1:99-986(+)